MRIATIARRGTPGSRAALDDSGPSQVEQPLEDGKAVDRRGFVELDACNRRVGGENL